MRSILSSTGGQNRGRSERRYRTDSVSLGNRIEESDAGRASATFGPIDGPATWNSKWIAQLCSSRWVAWCESTESRAAGGGLVPGLLPPHSSPRLAPCKTRPASPSPTTRVKLYHETSFISTTGPREKQNP